jgi:two-component system nitrate/nitrite response regulator NarL
MTASVAIVVQICHDDPILAAGLGTLIGREPDLAVEAALAADDDRIDVIVTNYARALELLEARRARQCAGQAPRPRIVVLTRRDREGEVLHALNRGAHGYLLQDARPEELIDAIRYVARVGTRYLCRRSSSLLAANPAAARFTSREQEVLRLLVRGERNKGIARQLEISANTVKAHVASICEKLQVTSRTQVAVVATNRGLIGA